MKKYDHEIEWVNHNTHLILLINGESRICVSCKKQLEYSIATKKCIHKCSTKHENIVEGSGRAHSEFIERSKSYGERLSDGFSKNFNQ